MIDDCQSKRGDFLLSLCLVSETGTADEIDALRKAAGIVDSRFQYSEIVYVLSDGSRSKVDEIVALTSGIRNLRIILVNDEIGYYQRRAVGVSEALGDVVILTAFNEVASFDIESLASSIFEQGEVMIGTRAVKSISFEPLHLILRALSTHRVRNRYLKTIALPRDILNRLLVRPTLALDLRFPSKQGDINYVKLPMIPGNQFLHSGIGERYRLAIELLTNSLGRFLRLNAALSAMVILCAVLYSIYAVTTFFVTHVQEGWLSISLLLSGLIFLVGCSMAVLSLGLAEQLDRANGHQPDLIRGEISNLSIFGRVDVLNVVVADADTKQPENS